MNDPKLPKVTPARTMKKNTLSVLGALVAVGYPAVRLAQHQTVLDVDTFVWIGVGCAAIYLARFKKDDGVK